ncbi:MAG: hypothetical protein ABII72_02570 [Parcubacteria group bacterium]
MKIYFLGPKTKDKKLQTTYKRVVKILERARIVTSYKVNESEIIDFGKKALEQANESGETLIAKMNGFIIEVSTPSPEISYLLAYAVLQKKPTLCLCRKGILPQVPPYLMEGEDVAKFLRVEYYSAASLERVIFKYLKSAEKGMEKEEVPNIKFTLRITPLIEKYLHWKSRQKKIPKAEFLRQEVLEKTIKEDKKYQEYLAKRS